MPIPRAANVEFRILRAVFAINRLLREAFGRTLT